MPTAVGSPLSVAEVLQNREIAEECGEGVGWWGVGGPGPEGRQGQQHKFLLNPILPSGPNPLTWGCMCLG